MPVAIIDLGTNTFHLLIAQSDSKGFREIYRERRYIKLGEHSPDFIGPSAFQRGLTAMRDFKTICINNGVSQIHAMGTAMLRNAINTPSFVNAVHMDTGIQIEVIDGLEEARLIFEGVKNSGILTAKENLLMDIGGGSVEFIFSKDQRAEWFESTDIGVALLKHRFPVVDHFTSSDISKLENYLDLKLEPIFSKLHHSEQLDLVGISGTFDVIWDHFSKKNPVTKNTGSRIPSIDVINFCNRIIPMSIIDKLNHTSIPESRADLISYALVMVKKVIQESSCKQVKVSQYSIKEGKLAN